MTEATGEAPPVACLLYTSINGRIKEMKNDGTLSGLREKWNLEEDNSDNSELRENKGDTKVVVVEENAATATAAASASAS